MAWRLPAAVMLGALALHASTVVAVHRFDAVTYALAAASPDPARWFNPHHLLYVWLARRLGALAGAPPATAMRWLSAASAAAALGAQAALLGALVARPGWALAGTALLGVSAAFWVSATETDMYALTVLTLVGAAACAVRAAARPGVGWHAAAGLLTALSILVHQLSVLFALAYVAALAVAAPPSRRRAAVAFLVPAAGASGAVYLAVGLGAQLFHDVPSFLAWMTTYAHAGYWGIFRARNLADALYGLLYAAAPGAGGLVPRPLVWAASALALALAGWGVAGWARAAADDPRRRMAAALCAGWVVIDAAFIVWYAPFHTPHWLLVLPPLTLLAALAADHATARSRRGARAVLAVALAFVALVGALNYVRVVWPLTVPENDVETRLATRVAATLPAGVRVVAPIGVAAQLLAERLGREAVFVVPHAPSRRETRAEVLERLARFVAGARGAGRPVVVFAGLLGPAPRGSRLADPELRRGVGALLGPLAAAGGVALLDTRELEAPPRRHPLDPGAGRGA